MENTICVFGASTTYGFWDLEKGGWINRLRFSLNPKKSEDYITLYNLGVDGNDTSLLLKRFEVECRARDPKIIIVSIGGNDSFVDSKGKSNVSLKKFKKNIAKIIKLAKKFADKIVFLGLYDLDESKTRPVSWDKNVSYINENMKEYDKALREKTKERGVFYIDMYGLLNNKDFEDGVHPNSKGHEKIFNKVKNYLIENNLI